jgi:hypothetical protein
MLLLETLWPIDCNPVFFSFNEKFFSVQKEKGMFDWKERKKYCEFIEHSRLRLLTNTQNAVIRDAHDTNPRGTVMVPLVSK